MPKTRLSRAQRSGKPAKPSRDRFAFAQVVRLDALAEVPYQFGVSPDGRWLAYVQEGPAGGPMVYDFVTDRRHGPFPAQQQGEIGWTQDSSLLVLTDMAVDLTSGTPRVVPAPSPKPRLITDEQGCGHRDDDGHLTGSNLYFSSLEERQWASERPVVYQLLKQPGSPDRVVAVEGDTRHELVTHDNGWVKERWKALGFPPRFPLPPAATDQEFRGRLSPSGKYLYYELRAGGGGWGGPPTVTRRFVVDVKSRPVQVWEIDVEVQDIRWHPNGHDLLLRLRPGPRVRWSPFAAVSLPE